MLSPNSFDRARTMRENRKSDNLQMPKIKDIRQAEALELLPLNFQVKNKEEFANCKMCQLCEIEFSTFFRPHHCRRCACTCCEKCSLKRRLSQEDNECYFTCNKCDFEITNVPHLQSLFEQM